MDRITDRLDMTSAVYRGRKASTQTNKQIISLCSFKMRFSKFLIVFFLSFDVHGYHLT